MQARWLVRLKPDTTYGPTSTCDLDKRNLVDPTLGHDDLPVVGGLDVADDTAAAGNDPALELFGFDVEAHEHVFRLDCRLDVPDRAVKIGDAVRLRARAAR